MGERRGDWERGAGNGKTEKIKENGKDGNGKTEKKTENGKTGNGNGNNLKNLGIWQKRKTNKNMATLFKIMNL